MKKLNLLYFVPVILAVAFLSNGCGQNNETMMKAPLVKTEQVGATDKNSGNSYAGEVRGRYESQLAFQVGGKIIARKVELGSKVHAGEVLMEIDAQDILQSANIGAAQVESAKAQLALAEANLNRFRKLYEEAAVSAAQYEQYQTNYDAALAAYKQAQAQYAQGSNAVGYTQLLADGDGVIAAVQAESGQIVAAGQSVVTLVKSGEMEVEINIPENRLNDMAPGQPVNVQFWALSDVALTGIVREISPIADKVARTYKTRVTLIDPPPEIRLGMTATVKCNLAGDQAGVVIPLAAVYQTGGQPKVWVVKDNIVHLQDISIEAFGENQVKVTAGLQAAETIVTAGVHKLREGQEVRVSAGDAQ